MATKALALDPTRVRFNDGKIDPQGRLWLGTMAIDEKSPIAGLYHLVGQILEQVLITVNAAKVCACCFGGPEMKHLFISTAKEGSDDPPGSGTIFVAEPGARGVVSASPQGID